MADKNIKITISNRRAIVEGSPVIVCGNSGYTVTFSFDDEWNLTGTRTARFVYVKDGGVHHEDKVFSGDVVAVPVLSDVAFVKVGVFAGDLQTTTPARINCELSILCGSGKVEEPTPDVYNQIMALFNEMAEKGAFGATEEQMQRVAANEEAIQALKTGAVLAGDAEKLGGQLPSHYATAQSVADLEQAIEDGTTKAGDAEKLGGQLPSHYATAQSVADLVSGTTPVVSAEDADTVDGYHASAFLLRNGISVNYLGFTSENELEINIDGTVYPIMFGMTRKQLADKFASFLPLDGSVPMSGQNLLLAGGYGRLHGDTNCATFGALTTKGDISNVRAIEIYNPTYEPTLAYGVRLKETKNGVMKFYDILHTGNSAKVTITSGKDVPPSTMEGLWAY